MGLLEELKRRNVIRMAGLYLVAAWLIVQVAGTLLPVFEAPSWVMRSLVGLLVVGFVPALIFSWVFELTPDGIKRDAEVPPEQSIAPQTARRLDRTIIVVLVIALGYFGFDKFVLAPRREAAAVAATTGRGSEYFSGKEVAAGDLGSRPARYSDPLPKSVAVLPFVNMSGDPKNEFFSDGITEEILNALAQIADLKVAARTSAFAFKGKDPDLRKVGEVLGVATVLEGSVQRAGDQVRITAQLIDTRSGFHLWSQKFDREMTNLFAVEDEISKAIADKLQLQLAGARPGGGGSTSVAQAHELYLRGLTLLAARGPGLQDAVAAFSQAVKLDPAYAQAWGALAEAEQLLPSYMHSDLEVGMERAESAAQRALGIDPDTTPALVAMANVYAHRMEWARADETFRRTLALAPGDVEGVNQYAQFLFAIGQHEAALRQIDRARQLDPLSAIIGVVRATILMALHREADAVAEIEPVLTAHPDFYPACMTAVLLYVNLQRYPDAEAQLRVIARRLNVDADAKASLVRGIANPGARVRALRDLAEAPANADLRGDSIVHCAFLALLGDPQHAIDQLEILAVRRDAAAAGLLWTRSFDALRDDPRYKAVLKKMNLPFVPQAGATP
jgi:TolB-like protein/Tfp pilus assembly protein PilF